MHRSTIAAVAGALAAACVLAVTEVAVAEPGPVVASVTGAGQLHVGATGEALRTFSVSARRYADGTSNGEAQIENRLGQFGPIHVEIDCLRVVANTAFMSGTVTHVGDPTLGIFIGSKGYFAVRDNGEGPDAPPDEMSFALFTGETTGPTCEEISDIEFVLAVEDGNIQVRS